MQTKRTLLSIFILAMFTFSCHKKNEVIIATSIIYPSYAALKPGNYWIYQQFDIDSEGNAVAKNIFDSCYVEKDTTIKGHIYFKLLKPKPYTSPLVYEASFLRDSLHYVINSLGAIKLSSQEYASTFSEGYQIVAPNDTMIKFSSQMEDKITTVNTPAGTIPTINCKYTYVYSANSKNGNFANKTQYVHARYAEKIGLVIETLPFIKYQNNSVERRLLRYHLN